jgi:hypothetical protein
MHTRIGYLLSETAVTVVAVLPGPCGDDRLEPGHQPRPCPSAVFHLEPCALALSRTVARVSSLTGAVGRAFASPQVAISVGALAVPEMALRRDLMLTTFRQSEQGCGRRRVPGLRPGCARRTTSVHSRRCAGSIPTQTSSMTLKISQRHSHPGDLSLGTLTLTWRR